MFSVLFFWSFFFFFNIPRSRIAGSAAAAAKSLQFVSDSVQPHRQQPTRLPRSWDSPDKNTGVGCHFLLQCVKVTSASKGNTGRGSKVDRTRGAPASTGPMGGTREASSCAAGGATRAKSAESSLRRLTAGLANAPGCPAAAGVSGRLRSRCRTGSRL